MFLWLSSNSCPVNFLLVQSHQAEIIIVNSLIQGPTTRPGWGLNPDHVIKVVVKTRLCTFGHATDLTATEKVFDCIDLFLKKKEKSKQRTNVVLKVEMQKDKYHLVVFVLLILVVKKKMTKVISTCNNKLSN